MKQQISRRLDRAEQQAGPLLADDLRARALGVLDRLEGSVADCDELAMLLDRLHALAWPAEVAPVITREELAAKLERLVGSQDA